MKVCVWDDETNLAEGWKKSIEDLFPNGNVLVEACEPGKIEHELSVLHERRHAFLQGDEGYDSEESVLDSTSVLVVDNDLFDIPSFNDYTAEMVATRAGVYTDCGYIVVLNYTPDTDFDLSLVGHPDSKADLHVNAKFVADPGLWHDSSSGVNDFRPWHWPLLIKAPDQYRARVERLEGLLEESGKTPIVEFLDFPGVAVDRLSRLARAYLHPQKEAHKVSFWDFVENNARVVSPKEGKLIVKRRDCSKLARVGARRLSKWLARLVVGPQNVLVDLPHVVDNLPFVVPSEQRESIDSWNKYASLTDAPVEAVTEALSVEPVRTEWVDRPVYWAHQLDTEEILDLMLGGDEPNPLELVFCEDSSAFHIGTACHRFVASYGTGSDGRFVRWLNELSPSVKYGPQSRLAM